MSMLCRQSVEPSLLAVAVALCLSSGPACAVEIPDPYPTAVSVSSIVTQTGPQTWEYQFTIHNNSVAHDFGAFGPVPWAYWFMIPYFSDAGITNVTCPGTC